MHRPFSMTESQKLFASVSGAFFAHLLLLFLVVALPRSNSAGSSPHRERPDDGPREVTVLMGDLMERLAQERREKEEEKKKKETPPEPVVPASRPFVATDLNRREAVAPDDAAFESDRNTSAASRLRPDPSLPQANTPTLAGKNPLPHLTLANREFVEGPPESLPASPDPVAKSPFPAAANAPGSSATVAVASPPPAPPPPSAMAGGKNREGELSVKPGEEGTDPEGATLEKSFLDPDARIQAPVLPDLAAGKDQLAAGIGSGRDGKGEPDPLASGTEEGDTDENPPPQASPDPVASASSPESTPMAAATADAPRPAEATPADDAGGLRTAESGLFAEGFSPEERQNIINGSLAKEGADAIDAADTPMGRYKKAVRDAISAKWHRYRQDNADFVTWGILKIEFSVDPGGRVRNLKITKNEANAMLAEFSLRAIREADLPPMPADVAKSVGSQGLVIQYDIIIY